MSPFAGVINRSPDVVNPAIDSLYIFALEILLDGIDVEL